MVQKNKIVTVFGGSGFVGRYVVKKLAEAGYHVRIVSRTPDDIMAAKVSGNVGQIVLQKGDITNVESVRACVKDSWAVVNLVGLLYESGRQKFSAIHAQGAEKLAKEALAAGAENFVQVSSLGVDRAGKSKYAKTKFSGEQAVSAAFPGAIILRPSVIFGAEDNFFNMFACMARYAPALPLIGGGKTKFQPVYVADVAEAVVKSLVIKTSASSAKSKQSSRNIYELAGPRVYTFRELLQYILDTTMHKRALISIPFGLAGIMGKFAELLPKPMLTADQVTLLQYDNIPSGGFPGLVELGIDPTPIEAIVPKYLERFVNRKARTQEKYS